MLHQDDRAAASAQASRSRGCAKNRRRYRAGLGGGRRIAVSTAFSPSRSDQNSTSRISAAAVAIRNGAANPTLLLQIDAEPRAQRPRRGAGEDPHRLEMPQRRARDVVEQIELAGDLDAGEGERAEHQPAASAGSLVDRQQLAADGQRDRAEREHEPPPDQPHQERNAEPPGHGDQAGADIEQRHRSRVAQQVQRLQRHHGQQDRLRHGRDEEQAEEGQSPAGEAGWRWWREWRRTVMAERRNPAPPIRRKAQGGTMDSFQLVMVRKLEAWHAGGVDA